MTFWNGSEWVPERRVADRRQLRDDQGMALKRSLLTNVTLRFIRTNGLALLGSSMLIHYAAWSNVWSLAAGLTIVILALGPTRMRIGIGRIFSADVGFGSESKACTRSGPTPAPSEPSISRDTKSDT
jgi:hypothetical protein